MHLVYCLLLGDDVLRPWKTLLQPEMVDQDMRLNYVCQNEGSGSSFIWHLIQYLLRFGMRRLASQRPHSFCRPSFFRGRSLPCAVQCLSYQSSSTCCQLHCVNAPQIFYIICTFLRLVTTSLVGGSEQGLPLLALNIGGSTGLSTTLSSSVNLLLLLTTTSSVSLPPSLPSLHR